LARRYLGATFQAKAARKSGGRPRGDHPAAIEIGIYRTLLNDSAAKQNCVDFIASILADKSDAATVVALKQAKDLSTRDGLTMEITPATDPDAYGGWWVSVYSEKELDAARAIDEELKQITVARDIRNAPPPAKSANSATKPTPAAVALSQPKVASSVEHSASDRWTTADMNYARSSSSSTSGGSVYVRGYYRKNGTYVQPHTRRR
jgi:hypothetical protein